MRGAVEVGLLVAIAVFAIAIVRLTSELARNRAVLEPIARSPLVRGLAGLPS